ncbi:hypothetical protein VNO80_16617 [Phaseolus coccineus]|uniref:Uncharacterized protein n=1 Tax=Phaseolus coccineus TaxID=3886 RepID=A0AAN9R862_PHACN
MICSQGESIGDDDDDDDETSAVKSWFFMGLGSESAMGFWGVFGVTLQRLHGALNKKIATAVCKDLDVHPWTCYRNQKFT